MLTLDAIVALDMIARKGSFAAAAEALGKVPSALSYQIRKLEDELDALIFDRRQRKVTLTTAGEMLLAQGRELLNTVDLIQAQVKELASEVSITLHTSRLNPWFVQTELWRSFS